MPGKKKSKGNYLKKVNNLDIYQNIIKPTVRRDYTGNITQTPGSISFDIYHGRKKIKEFKELPSAESFAINHKIPMTKKKKRKLNLIK